MSIIAILTVAFAMPPTATSPIDPKPPVVARDDTAKLVSILQTCVREHRDPCRVPWGTYYVRQGQVRVPSDLTIEMSSVVLRALPSEYIGGPHIDSRQYFVLACIDCRNTTIKNGRIVGERRSDRAKWSEFRQLVFVQGAVNFRMEGTVLEDTEGDGICEYPIMRGGQRQPSEVVQLVNLRTNRCGRNGVSILSARGFKVAGCTFRDTNGRSPQSGVCIEPERGDAPSGIIDDIVCENNRGSCVDVALQHSTDLDPAGVIVVRRVTSRGDGSGLRLGGSGRPRARPYADYLVTFDDVFVENANWAGVVVGLPSPTYDATYPVEFRSVLLRSCNANWLWHLKPGWVPTPITVDASCGWTGPAAMPDGVRE